MHPQSRRHRKFLPLPRNTLDFDDRIPPTIPDRTIRELLQQRLLTANTRQPPRCSDTALLKPITRAILLHLRILVVNLAAHQLDRRRDPVANQSHIREHLGPWKWDGHRPRTNSTDEERSSVDLHRWIIPRTGLVFDHIHSMTVIERSARGMGNWKENGKRGSELILVVTRAGTTCLPTN